MSEGFNPADLNRRDMDRIKGYKELLDFYHGAHWEGRERRGEKRLTFNYAKVFIDKVTSYLMSGIHFAVTDTYVDVVFIETEISRHSTRSKGAVVLNNRITYVVRVKPASVTYI